MKEVLNGDSGIPLYYQLKEIIKGKIDAGEWKTGDQIPNELDLVNEFKISRATVRQAVLDLVRLGILTREKGKGTFVSRPKFEGGLINFCFPKEFGTKHIPISVKEIACTPYLAKTLNLDLEENVYEVIRLRFLHDEPAALEKSYLPANISPDFLDNNFEGLLYDLLAEKYGVNIAKVKTFIEPTLLDQFEKKVLESKQKPALMLTRLGMSVQGNPLILNKIIIRGDRCKVLLYSEI